MFPFADDVVVTRLVTVCQILAFYRGLYTPGAGSLLIDKGDPMDGVGTDIGAVGAGTPAAADLFGTVCPDAARVLAATQAVVTTCPQPDVDGGDSALPAGTFHRLRLRSHTDGRVRDDSGARDRACVSGARNSSRTRTQAQRGPLDQVERRKVSRLISGRTPTRTGGPVVPRPRFT